VARCDHGPAQLRPATAHEGRGLVLAAGGDTAQIGLVENADWAIGVPLSLKTGLAALQADQGNDAVVVTLVDTPSVGREHLCRIGSALRGDAGAAMATYEGNALTPVGLTCRGPGTRGCNRPWG
jgi:CTP:molybdopterin cytidylyltransferase MocA